MVLLVALGLVAVLVVSGLALTWSYRPGPGGIAALRSVHRLASVLLLPASWVLAFAFVQATWSSGAGAPAGRARQWAAPALLVVAVPAAAFTGFLLPWERLFYATVVLAPDLRGMAPAFDAAVSAVSFGGDPIQRTTFQRYVLAHLFLGASVTALALLVARASGRRRPRRRAPSSTQ